jgi:hypothetical protein
VAALQQQIQILFSPILDCCSSVTAFFNGQSDHLRARRYWLEHDLAALLLLIFGMTAVGLLALII